MVDERVRKILDLPKDVHDLNYYVLLGVHPAEVSEESLAKAVRQCRSRLKRASKDPELKPLVARLATKILKAQGVLGDTRRRAEYDHRLDVRREEQAREARTQFRGAVNAALVRGKLPYESIPDLLKRAAELGVPDYEVKGIIDTTPKTGIPPASGQEDSMETMLDMNYVVTGKKSAKDKTPAKRPARRRVKNWRDDVEWRKDGEAEIRKRNLLIAAAIVGGLLLLALWGVSSRRDRSEAPPAKVAPAQPGAPRPSPVSRDPSGERARPPQGRTR